LEQNEESKARRPWFKKKRFIIPAVLLLLIIIGSANSKSSDSDSATPTPSATETETETPIDPPVEENTDWAPEGYKYFDELWDSDIPVHNVAYKQDPSGTCDYGTCFSFTAIAEDGCPNSLYVKANLLVDGVVEDWTNDATSTLEPGQVARMKLQFSSDIDGQVNWTEVNCY
jgi:hypothetical protein